MARVLAISSQVARGHVGLSAIVPALQFLGHDVIALPTVVLSNHPGHERCSGTPIGPDVLARMLDALDTNGWLAEVDAVITGYLPTADHVRFAVAAANLVRERHNLALVCVDPVLGDDPKGLYLGEEAAIAIREQLVPLADFATPNRFELGWLTRNPIKDGNAAFAAAMALHSRATLATSIPVTADRLANVLVMKNSACVCVVPRTDHAPHGTGDLLTALFIGHSLAGRPGPEALGMAVAGVQIILQHSQGRDELALTSTGELWRKPQPLPVERF